MDIVILVIKGIVGYIVLMLVGTNLIGIIVRGFIPTAYKNEEVAENISEPRSVVATIISCLIGIAYLYALYHFWNIGVVIAALVLMFTRIPDLIFEIKTGQKINSANMPKRPVDIMCTIIGWLALPLLFFSMKG